MCTLWTTLCLLLICPFCLSVDVCVVSAVDIHLHHFSKYLEHHNISVLQSVVMYNGRRIRATPDRLVDIDKVTRGIIYISSDLLQSVRFLVRRHMAMEYARMLHGNERWFGVQTSAAVKKPLFYYSRLAEVNADKSRAALRMQMGPEDERMYRVLEYVHGNGVDPIGLFDHFSLWKKEASTGKLKVPLLFVHMHSSAIGERPYSGEVGAALHKFLGIGGNSAHYLPVFDTRLEHDITASLSRHAMNKKPFAARVLNGTKVMARLNADMQNMSGISIAPRNVNSDAMNKGL